MDCSSSPLNAFLHPYAVEQCGGLGRQHPHVEKDGDLRPRFWVDGDRITHSAAYRTMEKTQVYSNTVGTCVSTRWSHIHEVARLARTIARDMRLNHDLAEAIGLAHDLGHTPFGHEGEEALRSWMEQYGLSFEHNEQSYRIVTLLEHHCRHYRGLNLNCETLEGLQSHKTRYDRPRQEAVPIRAPGLEAQITDYADSIAYTARDIHDALANSILCREELQQFALVKEAEDLVGDSESSLRSALIHLLATDLRRTSEATILRSGIRTLQDVYSAREPMIHFSPVMQERFKVLQDFLFERMYRPPCKKPFVESVLLTVRALCDAAFRDTQDMLRCESSFEQQDPLQRRAEAVRDWLVGLTDHQALELAQRIGVPEGVLSRISVIFKPEKESVSSGV